MSGLLDDEIECCERHGGGCVDQRDGGQRWIVELQRAEARLRIPPLRAQQVLPGGDAKVHQRTRGHDGARTIRARVSAERCERTEPQRCGGEQPEHRGRQPAGPLASRRFIQPRGLQQARRCAAGEPRHDDDAECDQQQRRKWSRCRSRAAKHCDDAEQQRRAGPARDGRGERLRGARSQAVEQRQQQHGRGDRQQQPRGRRRVGGRCRVPAPPRSRRRRAPARRATGQRRLRGKFQLRSR